MTKHDIYVLDSRTKGAIFNEWKKTEVSKHIRFRRWWFERWVKQINEYFDMNLFLIPTIIRGKIPLSNYKWTEKPLCYEDALFWTSKDFNLAVVLEPSGLIAIDWDKRFIPKLLLDFAYKTLFTITPRGFHIYFKYVETKEKVFDLIREKLNGKPDMFRYSFQYCLLPLSIVSPSQNKRSKKRKPPKCYEWLNFTNKPLEFNEFTEEFV